MTQLKVIIAASCLCFSTALAKPASSGGASEARAEQLETLLKPQSLAALDAHISATDRLLAERNRHVPTIKRFYRLGHEESIPNPPWENANQSATEHIYQTHFRLMKILELAEQLGIETWQREDLTSRQKRAEVLGLFKRVRRAIVRRAAKNQEVLHRGASRFNVFDSTSGTTRNPTPADVLRTLDGRNAFKKFLRVNRSIRVPSYKTWRGPRN